MARDKHTDVRRRWAGCALAVLALLLLSSTATMAQSRFLRVGNLWDEYGAAGNEAWGGTCMVWPGGFWREDLGENYARSSASYRGFLYSVENYTVPGPNDADFIMPVDQPPGYLYPYYVVQRDIRNTPQSNAYQLIPGGVSIVYKSNPATVTTDGVANANPQTPDGPEDPTLPADAKLVSWWRNNMGLQTTRIVYAFAHPLHSNYHVWHYSFKNTGMYCCASKNAATGSSSALKMAGICSPGIWRPSRLEARP